MLYSFSSFYFSFWNDPSGMDPCLILHRREEDSNCSQGVVPSSEMNSCLTNLMTYINTWSIRCCCYSLIIDNVYYYKWYVPMLEISWTNFSSGSIETKSRETDADPFSNLHRYWCRYLPLIAKFSICTDNTIPDYYLDYLFPGFWHVTTMRPSVIWSIPADVKYPCQSAITKSILVLWP